MDWGSVSGLLIALISILVGQTIEGGSFYSLIQPAAFVVVVFGTLGAVLLQTKPKSFWLGLRMLRLIFVTPKDDSYHLLQRIMMWSSIARNQGLIKLEPYVRSEQDPFIKKGLRLLVDGIPISTIQNIYKSDIYHYETAQLNAIKVWDSAGGYSPTLGILGAVLGLIHIMENLSNPDMLGAGIAVAFVATIYGVGLANLVFIPIANKLKDITQTEVNKREMLLDGLSSIANLEHSLLVKERLSGYLT